MKKIKNEIRAFFSAETTTISDPKKYEELKQMVRNNAESNAEKELKTARKKISIWKKITITATAICMIALIMIPILLLIPNNSTPPIYYGDDEATKVNLTEQQAKDIINNGYSQYSFIFDYQFDGAVGFYAPNSNKLLAIKVSFTEGQNIITLSEINLVVSNQFIFSKNEEYTKNIDPISCEGYLLYKTINDTSLFNKSIKGLLDYKQYDLYISMNRINNTLFEKFL